MKLRTWLVLSFVGFALIAVVLFGAVTYQIANDNQIDRETDSLQYSLKEQAATIMSRGGVIRWKDWLQRTEPGDDIYLVLTKTGSSGLRPTMSSTSTIPIDSGIYTPLIKQILAGETRGQSILDGESYLWVTAKIDSSPYTLLALHQLGHHVSSPLKTVGVRIIAAGVVVVWIAVWGGLVIAGLFMKRQEKHNADILHQVLHDELTGLPNRTLLYDRLQQAINLWQRAQKTVALLIMDLDQFKEINDALGHQSGDQILIQTAKRLLEVLRDTDTVARLGGDEFALLLPAGDAQQATQLAAKVLKALEPPYQINGIAIDVKASVGIAIYPNHGNNADDLIRHADVAMYQAKQQGSGFMVYSTESDTHSLNRLTLQAELRHAIENDKLALYYQPQVDLASGSVIGVEALLRWHHPQRGFIPPDTFIPLAEKSGLITILTELVLNKAFHQYKSWQQEGILLTIAINLSARNLHDIRLPSHIFSMLSALMIPAGHIHLEITESAMMADPAKAKQVLDGLDNIGLGLAIDDFGTGYSSLSYLKRLPVSVIKIDKSFVIDMTKDEGGASIVRATIDLAHTLGLKVVAEGVEDMETLSALKKLGCDIAQGYYISKPIPAEELVRWLANNNFEFKPDSAKAASG